MKGKICMSKCRSCGFKPHIPYTYWCCGGEVPTPSNKYPISGAIKGSCFVLNENIPYLFDTTFTTYGPIVCFDEHVHTNITQRNSQSCIDLAATFDMTDTILPNDVRVESIETAVGKKHAILNGNLPIIKNEIKFKVIYTITDSTGGVVYNGECFTTSTGNMFHFTDINDRFVMSDKNCVIDVIPTLPSNIDCYTLTVDRVEAYVNVIDTSHHINDNVNPFYKFTNNDTQIQLNSDVILQQTPDKEILFATCDVNTSFYFYPNITTRFRMTFTACMSNLIVINDTTNISYQLTSPTDDLLDDALKRIQDLEEKVKGLEEVTIRLGKIVQNQTDAISKLNKSIVDINDMAATIELLDTRVSKLEEIPLAVLVYHKDTEYTKGQLIWSTAGQIYQVVDDYISSGSLTDDATNGNIVYCGY